jgi:hypothetical protein
LKRLNVLAKVIKLNNPKGGAVSVASVLEYLSRDEAAARDVTDYTARDNDPLARNTFVEGGTFNLEGVGLSDPIDRDLMVGMMDHIAAAGRQKTNFKTNPIYHYALSWREGEIPTQEQAALAAAHTLKALGLEENQAFFVTHRDKEHHHHIHVVANRVHPEKLVLTGPPRFDFLVLDKACRELEMIQGWEHDNGPHAFIDGEIQRLTKSQRNQIGLISHRKTEHSPTPAARMMEIHTGAPSFSEWMRERVAPELDTILKDPQGNWQQIHKRLGEHGVRMEQRGGGLALTTAAMGRDTSTKASGVDYRLSLGRLEKQFGPFQPTAFEIKADSTKTYSAFVLNTMAGREFGENPGRTGNGLKRDQQRMARQELRDALIERYKTEKAGSKQHSKTARDTLRQVHQQELKALRDKLKANRAERVNELADQFGSKRIAAGMYAAEKAIALEEIKTQHKIQKADVVKSLNMDWPAWLERQAEGGDEAAISALRGIRYKEQRKKAKARPGFEGEDLEKMIEPQSNGIAGAPGQPWSLKNARIEIDHERQRIIYKDELGEARLVDQGPRIDLVNRDDKEAMRQGLMLASHKYGNEVYITGDQDFRERAAREAARMGIKVADKDLHAAVEHEKQRIANERNGGVER